MIETILNVVTQWNVVSDVLPKTNGETSSLLLITFEIEIKRKRFVNLGYYKIRNGEGYFCDISGEVIRAVAWVYFPEPYME